MRYSASEKFEIIELVEQSSLSIRRTLAPIGIPRSTFYDWYSRYQEGGIEALEDGKPRPRRIWNKIPDKIRTAIVNLALEESDLSPRELAVNFTDTNGSFVSEASVYRLLKDHGLITSPAFILMKAADRFANPTTAPNQLWQTDFTYLKVIGWGWFYLSTESAIGVLIALFGLGVYVAVLVAKARSADVRPARQARGGRQAVAHFERRFLRKRAEDELLRLRLAQKKQVQCSKDDAVRLP